MSNKNLLVVVSKTKEYVKTKEVTVGAEAIEALSEQMKERLDRAAAKALADGRKVIKPRDLE